MGTIGGVNMPGTALWRQRVQNMAIDGHAREEGSEGEVGWQLAGDCGRHRWPRLTEASRRGLFCVR